MNKSEFTKYITENFDCSLEAADAIITIFSESISSALSEGHTVELENLGEFKVCNVPSHNIYSFKQGKALATPPRKQLYFKAARDLKVAVCN